MIQRRTRAPLVALVALSTIASAQSSSVSSFDLERLVLNPAGRDGLLVGGGDVLDPRGVRLSILGTDDRGKAEANRKLSLARGDSVKSYLVKKGIAPARLEARGFGPDKPIADNKKPEGREQNRRVEFVIQTGTTTREIK